MISRLEGKVTYIGGQSAIIDVHGVGYKVHASADTLSKLKEGQDASFWTYLAVREDALDLYGFPDKESHDFFTLLITVSGIGPKSALGILNVVAVATLRKAIAKGDPAYITKISGIGSKKAEKIVLELKDKLTLSEAEMKSELGDDSDAIAALESLGYSEREAREGLKKIPAEFVGTSARVKAALKILGK